MAYSDINKTDEMQSTNKLSADSYLDRLLVRYAGTFDIYTPYNLGGMTFPAYGYFYSHIEKFVLTRGANMWSSDSYEHILFLPVNEVTPDMVATMKRILLDEVEPKLVLKGEEVPPPNHMYSYMSVILISEKKVSKDTVKAVKKLSYDKGYMMNMRGFSQAQICLVSIEDEKVYHNFAAHGKKKTLKGIFKEVKEGRVGFKELVEKGELIPFSQKEQ
jgi:hypothetical protein